MSESKVYRIGGRPDLGELMFVERYGNHSCSDCAIDQIRKDALARDGMSPDLCFQCGDYDVMVPAHGETDELLREAVSVIAKFSASSRLDAAPFLQQEAIEFMQRLVLTSEGKREGE